MTSSSNSSRRVLEMEKEMEEEKNILEAWVYNPSSSSSTTPEDAEDRRLPHQHLPNRPIPHHHLAELGVLHWRIDADKWETDPALEKVKSEQGYIHWETLTVAPGVMEDYDNKTKHFFEEHLHPYEESRLILEGSGYWDIRDYSNNWIRFKVGKGDMITLPPGMYHRFTVDTTDYIKAVLLYKEAPRRIDVLRPHGDETQARKDYVINVLSNENATYRPTSSSTVYL